MTKQKKRKTIGTFDPTARAMLNVGLYPAHIVGVDIASVKTKIGLALAYNLDYRLAKEVEKYKQPLFEQGNDGNFKLDEDGNKVITKDADGNDIELSCAFAVGREYKFHRIWCFTEEEGKGANGKYADLVEISGVEVDTVEVQPGIKVKQLVELTEKDLLGKPVLIRIDYKPRPTKETKELPKEQQEFHYWPRVVDVLAWNSGEPLDSSEFNDDLPF